MNLDDKILNKIKCTIKFYKPKYSDLKYLFISNIYNYKKINFIKLISKLINLGLPNELIFIMLNYITTVL
jgi:hypothetical protein